GRGRGGKRGAVAGNPLAPAVIASRARKRVMARTRGKCPAVLRAIEMVAAAVRTPMSRAAAIEAGAIAELAAGPVCKSLISIFKGSEAAKKLGKGKDGFEPRRFERGAVIGAGVMGGAIASSLAEKGLQTRLGDLAAEANDAALLEHRADVAKKQRKRRLTKSEAMAAVDRLDATSDLSRGFGGAQIVIEAVAERLDVKQKVFQGMAAQVADDCLLATNTSSLSVTAIAAGLPHPERVVGMHFFNPVKKMPLVEVIRGAQTSEAAVTEIAALAVRLGKTPVIVADVAGFLVNRLLGPYLDEAIRLFEDGADPVKVDKAMLDFGMPMGPFLLLDEVGLDIASHASQSLLEAYGERMTPATGVAALMGPDRLGKKTGHGFYKHSKDRKVKPVISADLAKHQQAGAAAHYSDQQIVDRLVLSMVNEAARCLEEKVVESAEMLDLATVFGTGFAPFRGGLLRYADGEGLGVIRDKLRKIAEMDVASRPGGKAKFTPAKLIEELAESGGTFRG
ncbi:MAG: fatty acid oxidation complex subunit alpha FadJ, partial [Planctomycetes bacterium]|nr:fatty acid oxidation complex subunit alpha FadJ [Planctomycetota bacterium]